MSPDAPDAPDAADAALAAAVERLLDARARHAQAELEHELVNDPATAEIYAPMGYWASEVVAATAAWRALAGPDAAEPT